MSNPTHKPAVSRRAILRVGASGLMGLSLADILRAESQADASLAKARAVIFMWLGGGPATIDMWDPKPDASKEIRGEFTTIGTSIAGVRFSEHMQATARLLKDCTLIRSMTHKIPDHTPGGQYVMTGNMPNQNAVHPSLGSLVSRLVPASAGLPTYFCLGQATSSDAGFLGAQHDPFRIQLPRPREQVALDGVVLPASVTNEQLQRRRELRSSFDRAFIESRRGLDIVPTLSEFQQQAFDVLSSNRVRRAFDLADEAATTREAYGESSFGHAALTARRLVEAGARFVTIGTEGWDTHSGNFATLRQLLPPLDRAVAALIEDLKQRGMLDSTIVACGGEFGRTPAINAAAGRDHWSNCFSFLLAGGDFRAGCIVGETDRQGMEPTRDACSPDDLAATILSQFGFAPQTQVQMTTGRPMAIFPQGKVLKTLAPWTAFLGRRGRKFFVTQFLSEGRSDKKLNDKK